jgi:hypothetical protein
MMESHQSNEVSLTSAQDTSLELTAGLVSGHQSLSVVENISDEEDDNETVITGETEEFDPLDDSDENEEEDLETVFGYNVDLVAQESKNKDKPIYTRGLLSDVKLCANQIHKELSLAPIRRELYHLDDYGLNQKSYRVWESHNNRNDNYLQVEYLSRVEMHPDFQHRYGKYSDQIRALRRYNKDHRDDCIDTPYTFITFHRQFLNEHNNIAKMREYWSAVMHTKSLWIPSMSRRKLQETFQETGKTCAPITKVLCFGLGAFNLNKKFYHSAIQYMAVFSIIQALNEFYLRNDANRALIKLVLQDPNYELKDHQLLRKLFHSDDNISFVSDPEGLLAIDSGTLVVTAFLPVQMPLVQIIADLFSKDASKGPVAVICDTMTVDTAKREYSLSDRASPAAARFLTSHYEKTEDGFEEHGLDDELMADAYGDDGEEKNRLYWLNRMDLWVRKTGTN